MVLLWRMDTRNRKELIMAIVKPSEMDFTQDNIIMLVSGLPGVGKTTLACSASDVIVIDVDDGMKRVKPEHRKTAIRVSSYEELLEDLKSKTVQEAKTLVIDTCGALIELMKDWAAMQQGGAKKGGGISLQGFGIVKSEFNRLFRELRRTHNCVLLFHSLKDKDREGNIIYDIQCEGATKQTVWQPVDLGAYMQIIDGKRYLCFSPTQEYSAKSSFGVSGMVEVPELSEEDQNSFLDKLFTKVKDNMSKEAAASQKANVEYENIMAQGLAIIAEISDAASIQPATEKIKKIGHVLTTKAELQHALKARIAELGLKWNSEKKCYE